jgi:hypothetical protein
MGHSNHSPSTKTPASPTLVPALKAIAEHRGVQAAAALWVVVSRAYELNLRGKCQVLDCAH